MPSDDDRKHLRRLALQRLADGWNQPHDPQLRDRLREDWPALYFPLVDLIVLERERHNHYQEGTPAP